MQSFGNFLGVFFLVKNCVNVFVSKKKISNNFPELLRGGAANARAEDTCYFKREQTILTSKVGKLTHLIAWWLLLFTQNNQKNVRFGQDWRNSWNLSKKFKTKSYTKNWPKMAKYSEITSSGGAARSKLFL